MPEYDFYFARSGNSLRAAIALELGGVSVRRHLLDLGKGEHKSDWFKKITPAGHVPVLVIKQDGQELALAQSGAIMDHVLHETRPDLWPEDALERALCTASVHSALSDIAVQNALARYLAQHPDAAKFVLDRMWSSLFATFEPVRDTPYLRGGAPTVADYAHLPVVYMRAPQLKVDQRATHVIDWLDRMVREDPIARAIEYAGLQIEG